MSKEAVIFSGKDGVYYVNMSCKDSEFSDHGISISVTGGGKFVTCLFGEDSERVVRISCNEPGVSVILRSLDYFSEDSPTVYISSKVPDETRILFVSSNIKLYLDDVDCTGIVDFPEVE